MKIVGITGGVGSGKSRVLSFLETYYHAFVCQADQVAWKQQEPGQICYEHIVTHFGAHILREDGTIDRQKLGQLVFGNQKELSVLNQIVHPEVRTQICRLITQEKAKGTSLFVLEAALLLEAGYDEICDEVWYIYADEAVRRKRLEESRGYSKEKTDAIMASQISEACFREHAQVIIDNSGSFEITCEEIKKVMNK